MNSESEKNVVELYRCHPDVGGGIPWAMILLFALGVPLFMAIHDKDITPLVAGYLIWSPIIIMSLEQTLWQLFGEEIATLEDDYLCIHRKNRIFRRNWRVLLYEIGEVDYYVESKWRKIKNTFRFGTFAKDTLCLTYGKYYFQYKFAPGLPPDEQDEVLDRLEEAVAAAKERAGIKAEEEYWEAVAEFAENEEDISGE